MNWIDFLLLLIILLSMWNGWHKGFIIGSLDLIAWLGSLVIGFWGYPYIESFFAKHAPSLGVWSTPLAFLIAIIFARIILGLIIHPVIRNTPYETHSHQINKFLGIIPGFVNGVISATIIALLLLTVPFSDNITSKAQESTIAALLTPPAEWLEDKLAPVFDKAVSETMTKLTVEPNSEETINLHYTVKNTKARPDLELRMLDLVNEERTKRGLKPLEYDAELTEVARAHSRDMFARGYFSHYTPEGKDPFDRMKEAGVHFITAGENLALAKTLMIAHTGLMNSPGHRANILNPSFGRVGIGIIDGGIYELMISQEFRN